MLMMVSHCPRCLWKRFIFQVVAFLQDEEDDDDENVGAKNDAGYDDNVDDGG